jgi:murein DD-endopeptidase MepM/ murein hydrolase activator NlpD
MPVWPEILFLFFLKKITFMTHSRLFISIGLLFLFTVPMLLSAIEPDALPAGIRLSFNGKFVHDVPEGFRRISDNGKYLCSYGIGNVGDEIREINNFRLYENGILIYQSDDFPGSDMMISNAGVVAAFDMRFHFRQEVTILLINKKGEVIYKKGFRYASLFGFSPQGSYFGVGTGENLTLIEISSGEEFTVDHCSQFIVSTDEKMLATAKEDHISIYRNFEFAGSFNTGFFYPRAIALNDDGSEVTVIDKHNLLNVSTQAFDMLFEKQLPGHLAYRDVLYRGDDWHCGIHQKEKGISRGILRTIDSKGTIKSEQVVDERLFQHFENPAPTQKRTGQYESIPWPFVPFDEMHTVWNYYEQHMGNNYDLWSYLHQGLDMITPIDEPTYAVQAGYVKCVLTLGGDLYWRVAISQEQVPGYSDGWLYAHLVEGSIQVDVGDYVEIHDYLGDIIYWSDDWGHIHFVEIHDHGLIWYYDDDEWGINFNPLLALTPNDDIIAPVIHDFSSGSKFGFLVHGAFSNFLNPDNLYGDIDIIAMISDFHGSSPWELPAFKTYYSIKNIWGDYVVPKTLGRMLNHSYPYYSSGFYEDYAPILYHKDYQHLPPAWMSESRDYYHVLTRNNGDTLINLSDLYLSFPTGDFYDGHYTLFVEAYDECGNMAVDSQTVYFNNGNVSSINQLSDFQMASFCFPNPAKDQIDISFYVDDRQSSGELMIFNSTLSAVKKEAVQYTNGWNILTVNVQDLSPGIYYYVLPDNRSTLKKFVVMR